MRIFPLAAQALALAALMVSSAVAPAEEPTGLNPAWGVVFEGEKALTLVRQCSRPSPGPVQGTWTPTAKQIAELDDELLPALTVQLVQLELSDKGYQGTDYYRQYGGLIIHGVHVVYVNGFHRHLVEQLKGADVWKEQPIGICDGAELAFGAEYDPDAKTLANFHFNGSR